MPDLLDFMTNTQPQVNPQQQPRQVPTNMNAGP